MKTKDWQPWTELDRVRLRELAAVCKSDITIGRIMQRKPSAVGWQRRLLRIPLNGPKGMRHSAAHRHAGESHARVDRLLALAFKERAA